MIRKKLTGILALALSASMVMGQCVPAYAAAEQSSGVKIEETTEDPKKDSSLILASDEEEKEEYISVEDADDNVCLILGESVTLQVNASVSDGSDDTLTYQWSRYEDEMDYRESWEEEDDADAAREESLNNAKIAEKSKSLTVTEYGYYVCKMECPTAAEPAYYSCLVSGYPIELEEEETYEYLTADQDLVLTPDASINGSTKAEFTYRWYHFDSEDDYCDCEDLELLDPEKTTASLSVSERGYYVCLVGSPSTNHTALYRCNVLGYKIEEEQDETEKYLTPGGTITLTANAFIRNIADPEFTYQWYRFEDKYAYSDWNEYDHDGEEDSKLDETSKSLEITQPGYYVCMVESPLSAEPLMCRYEVDCYPIDLEENDATISMNRGGSCPVTVNASVNGSSDYDFTYQWYRLDNEDEYEAFSILDEETLDAAKLEETSKTLNTTQTGYYVCEVSLSGAQSATYFCKVTESTIELEVNHETRYLESGKTLSLTVKASSQASENANFSYIWYYRRDGEQAYTKLDETSKTLKVSKRGRYMCRVSSTATSETAEYTCIVSEISGETQKLSLNKSEQIKISGSVTAKASFTPDADGTYYFWTAKAERITDQISLYDADNTLVADDAREGVSLKKGNTYYALVNVAENSNEDYGVSCNLVCSTIPYEEYSMAGFVITNWCEERYDNADYNADYYTDETFSISEGESLTFTVDAKYENQYVGQNTNFDDYPSFTYQWYRADQKDDRYTEIAGATEASYEATEAGYYKCIVTDFTGNTWSYIGRAISKKVTQTPDLKVGSMEEINLTTGYDMARSNFCPEESGVYYFYTSGYCDTFGSLTNANGTNVGNYVDGSDNDYMDMEGNFVIRANLTAGKTYTLSVGLSSKSDETGISYVHCEKDRYSSYPIKLTDYDVCDDEDYGEITYDIADGETAALNVTAHSDDPSEPAFSYAWYKDGEVISGQTASSYQASEPGMYSCIVSDENGNAAKYDAYVYVNTECGTIAEDACNGVNVTIDYINKRSILAFTPETSGNYYFYSEGYSGDLKLFLGETKDNYTGAANWPLDEKVDSNCIKSNAARWQYVDDELTQSDSELKAGTTYYLWVEGNQTGTATIYCSKTYKKCNHVIGTVETLNAAASCDTAGYVNMKHCTECGRMWGGTVIPATGNHSYSAWKLASKATVKTAAVYERTCSACGKKETKTQGKALTPTAKVNAKSLALKAGQTTKAFKVTGMAAGDSVKTWKSSNTKVFTVKGTAKGTCTIKACSKYNKKACSAKLTITLASGKVLTVSVKVQKSAVAVTAIKGLPAKLTLKAGKTAKLSPVLAPITTTYKASYTSSNKKVARVSANGIIKAVKKGTAVITVKAGTKKVKVKVTVK